MPEYAAGGIYAADLDSFTLPSLLTSTTHQSQPESNGKGVIPPPINTPSCPPHLSLSRHRYSASNIGICIRVKARMHRPRHAGEIHHRPLGVVVRARPVGVARVVDGCYA
jgi:hypothetical protein